MSGSVTKSINFSPKLHCAGIYFGRKPINGMGESFPYFLRALVFFRPLHRICDCCTYE